MGVGSGSLADVQARAARLQRRRIAVRGGMGALALAAVAAIGFASLRGAQFGEFTAAMDGDDEIGAVAEAEVVTAAAADSIQRSDERGAVRSADAVTGDQPAPDAEQTTSDSAVDESPTYDAASPAGGAAESDESDVAEPEGRIAGDAGASGDAAGGDGPETLTGQLSSSGGSVPVEFAAVVRPLAGVAGPDVRYSFSGTSAVARAGASWYAHDGDDWQPVGLPDDARRMHVVAVDVSRPGRRAILGVTRSLECEREQVIAVHTGEGWSYLRVDDDTPSAVGRELLDARVRVADFAIVIERIERLWLDDQCPSPAESGQTALSAEQAQLLGDLARVREIHRASRLVAPLDGGFAERWPAVAHADVRAAVAARAGLEWMIHATALLPLDASRLASSRSEDPSVSDPDIADEDAADEDAEAEGAAGDGAASDTASLVLDHVTIMGAVTLVHVSDGMVLLQRGIQTWEVCPVSDEELDHVYGMIGRAGEHIAVVIGKPAEELFILERAE